MHKTKSVRKGGRLGWGEMFTPSVLFWFPERTSSQSLPGKLEVRSGNQKKKKARPPQNDPPLRTVHFSVCACVGGFTDVITHANFISIGSAVSALQGVEIHHFP